MLLLKAELDGRWKNSEESMKQSQGAGKGQKLASGTVSGKGSVKAAGTAEFLVRDRLQGAEGWISEQGIRMGWVQSKDLRYKTGFQSCTSQRCFSPAPAWCLAAGHNPGGSVLGSVG